MKKKWLLMAVCALLAFPSAVYAGQEGNAEEVTQQKEESTLTVGLLAMNSGIQTVTALAGENGGIVNFQMRPPFSAFDENGNVYDRLVESVEADETFTAWTMKIKDLTWNDGKPVTAEEVLFSMQYGVQQGSMFYTMYYGGVDFEKSEVIDDHTLKIVLTQPNPNFWSYAGAWTEIYRMDEYENVEDSTTHVYSGLGYGPYYMSEFGGDEYIVLEKNPYYTLEEGPFVDRIVYRFYQDENSLVLALESGDIDCCGSKLSPSSVSRLETNPSIDVLSQDSLGYTYLSFNFRKELPQDDAVRRAVAMCVDRDAIVAVGYAGAATPMKTPISDVFADYTASGIEQPPYDPEAAGALLEEAGYTDTDGDGIRETADGEKLSLHLAYSNELANNESIVTVIATCAAEAGIEILPDGMNTSTFKQKVAIEHDFDIYYSYYASMSSAEDYVSMYASSWMMNYSGLTDETVDGLVSSVMTEPVRENRIALVDQYQNWFVEKLPGVHLVVATESYAVNTEHFEGFKLAMGTCGLIDPATICDIKAK